MGVATHEDVAGKGWSGIDPANANEAVGDRWMFERRDGSGVEGFEMTDWAEAGRVELPACVLRVEVNSEGI